ncbi:MAG: hypothetical protein ABH817_00940 [archaeon]
MIFQIIGGLGILLIAIGILLKKRKTQDILYIFGGLALLAYSISINDVIFIILQSLFILAASYDLIKRTI